MFLSGGECSDTGYGGDFIGGYFLMRFLAEAGLEAYK